MNKKRDWYKCVNSSDNGECAEQGSVFPGHLPTSNNTIKKCCRYSSDGKHSWQKIPGNQNIETDLQMYPDELWNIEK